MRKNVTRALVAGAMTLVLGGGAAAFAAGGSGGGGGGGGTAAGGGTTTSATCGALTVAVTLDSVGLPQLGGTTSKACDTLPVQITFTDTGAADGCVTYIPTYTNPMYFKYGLKPPSRYSAAALYADPTSCGTTSRTIVATMTDRSTGAVYGTASTTWVR